MLLVVSSEKKFLNDTSCVDDQYFSVDTITYSCKRENDELK